MSEYVTKVLAVLQSGPTSGDLDFLVEAYANVGYLAAQAEGDADMAEAKRKHEEAVAYLEAKKSGDKMTDKQAEATAQVATWHFRNAELEARTKARKLRNLLESVEQAINAIKFLGRYDSPVKLP